MLSYIDTMAYLPTLVYGAQDAIKSKNNEIQRQRLGLRQQVH